MSKLCRWIVLFYHHFKTGIKKIAANLWLLTPIVIYLIAYIVAWRNRGNIGFHLPELIINWIFIIMGVVILMLIVTMIGTPFRAKVVNNALWRIGLRNSAGESPRLLHKIKDHKTKIITWAFEANGIPRMEWVRLQAEIETILNVNVVDITEGKRNKRRILLQTVSARTTISKKITWQNAFISHNGEFELVLGETLTGRIVIDLASTPHFLIGGGTGSGKTILLKTLIIQILARFGIVYIADFKGGIDFPAIWHDYCEFITDEEKLLKVLEDVLKELERRRDLFVKAGASKLAEYNQRCEPLPRIVIACDEIAEALDKSGSEKARREQVSQVESKLSTIARLGRAFGIHLLLSTQRPDANLLNGQIKANLPLRICGRADSILSQIILDNSYAAEKVPMNAEGLFVTNNGDTFQGFWLDESTAFDGLNRNEKEQLL